MRDRADAEDVKGTVLADKIEVIGRQLFERQELSSELKLALVGIRDECQQEGELPLEDMTATVPVRRVEEPCFVAF